MDFLKRTVRFIRVYLFSNPRYFFTYAINFFNPNYIPKIDYYELSELRGLLESGKSIIRFGDGEVYIMGGGDIGYQKFDSQLQKKLFDMVHEYTNQSAYILSLNRTPISKSNKVLKDDNFFNCWMPTKVFFNLFFNKEAKYADAGMFYFNETLPEYLESYLLTKHIVYVTHAGNIDKIKQNVNIPFTDVSYVETPAINAFSDYDSIVDNVRTIVKGRGVNTCIVMAACGPASKPLAYDLSIEGVVTIDVGRGVEIAYTDERIDHLVDPIFNKHASKIS